MSSPSEIIKVLTWLAALYPHFKLSKATIDAYSDMLSDLSADTLAAAARMAADASEFYPTAASIRKAARTLESMSNPVADHTSAWNELMTEVRRVGFMSWDETHWSSDLVRRVARIYWRDACFTEIDNLPTVRAQFRDSFNAFAQRESQMTLRLPGSNETIAQVAGRLNARTPRLTS